MAGNAPSVRILLADDHAVVRAGLRALLESRPGWKVVAEAADGEQALAAAARHLPDVILLDISMPKLDGIEAARRLRRQKSSARIVMVSINDDVGHAVDSLSAGAKGYIIKDSAADDLFVAIETVRAGGIFLSETLRAQLDDERALPAK